MSGKLSDLAQQWAEEAAERAELAAVHDLDDDDEPASAEPSDVGPVEVDREAALAQLRSEPDDDQPFRRCA